MAVAAAAGVAAGHPSVEAHPRSLDRPQDGQTQEESQCAESVQWPPRSHDSEAAPPAGLLHTRMSVLLSRPVVCSFMPVRRQYVHSTEACLIVGSDCEKLPAP